MSAARYFSDREILSFIENKKNWLEKTLRAVKIEQTLNSCEQEGHVYVFGKKKKEESVDEQQRNEDQQ